MTDAGGSDDDPDGSQPGREVHALLLELRSSPIPRSGTTYDQLLAYYGSNAAIATAAGLPTGAQAVRAYRSRHPRARSETLDRIRLEARRRRGSLMRNLQRYKRPARGAQSRRLEQLRAKLPPPGRQTAATVAQLMVEQGATLFLGYNLLVQISDDERWRTNLPRQTFTPGSGFAVAARAGDWTRAAAAFFEAWGLAYGMGYVTVLEADLNGGRVG